MARPPRLLTRRGHYRFNSLASGTYTVTPGGRQRRDFSTPTQNVTISGGHVFGVNFTGPADDLLHLGNDQWGSGEILSYFRERRAQQRPLTAPETTRFGGLLNGSYTVTSGAVGFTINPSSLNVTVKGANVSSVNFTGSSMTYSSQRCDYRQVQEPLWLLQARAMQRRQRTAPETASFGGLNQWLLHRDAITCRSGFQPGEPGGDRFRGECRQRKSGCSG